MIKITMTCEKCGAQENLDLENVRLIFTKLGKIVVPTSCPTAGCTGVLSAPTSAQLTDTYKQGGDSSPHQ